MAIDYNRQYVGARYVPQFFNNPDGSWDWAQGFQYEPLTMVKYGTNTYTSKQLVPATVGAPNANLEYWAQTGDYNGAIVNIQNELNSVENNLYNYMGSKLYNKKICFIGDSITVGATANVNYPSLIQQWSGAQCDNKAVNGATIVPTTGRTSYKSIVDGLSAPYDYIVVMLGSNDTDLGTPLISVINEFFSETLALIGKYPTAKLIICTPPFIQGKQQEINMYASAIKEASYGFNSVLVDVLNNSGISFFNSNSFLNDGIHPNDLGQAAIARCVLDACTHSPSMSTKYDIISLPFTSNVSGLTLSERSYIGYKEGIAYLYLSGVASSNISAGRLINTPISPVYSDLIEFFTQYGTFAVGGGYISTYSNIAAGKIDISATVPFLNIGQ